MKIDADYYPGAGNKRNNDVDGHGTHVASTAAGDNVGIATKADVLSIRVLDDTGSGSISTIIKGLKRVLKKKKNNKKTRMVVNMSLGSGASSSFNKAVRKLAKAGVPVVVAAGNEAQDACNVSPASEPHAITVASAEEDGDFATSYSNFGDCVDIIAPGSDILGACSDLSNPGCSGGVYYVTLDGTSMASPHVAGVVALYMRYYSGELGRSPSPQEIQGVLDCVATKDSIGSVPVNTPNYMVRTPDDSFGQTINDCLSVLASTHAADPESGSAPDSHSNSESDAESDSVSDSAPA